jgi:hypothetical protein
MFIYLFKSRFSVSYAALRASNADFTDFNTMS